MLLNDDIPTRNIACDCPGGRPGADQSGVICTNCGKWHHMNCKIGDRSFSASDARDGFQCRVCRKVKRSEAAKRGYQKRLTSGDLKGSSPMKRAKTTPLRSGAPRKSAPSVPSTAPSKVASQGLLGRYSGGRGSSIKPRTSFKLHKFQPTPLAKTADAANEDKSDNDEDDDGNALVCEQPTPSGGYITRSKRATTTMGPLPKRIPRRIMLNDQSSSTAASPRSMEDVIEDWKKTANQQIARQATITPKNSSFPTRTGKTQDDIVAQWKKSPSQREILCHCPAGGSHNAIDYIFCWGCSKMQHRTCMLGNNGNDGEQPRTDGLYLEYKLTVSAGLGIEGEFCNKCRLTLTHKQMKTTRERHRQARTMHQHQKMGITIFCKNVLWKIYCQLPSGEANRAVTELTSMYYDNGRMIPIHPAPQEWINMTAVRMFNLVNAAGNEKLREYQGPDGAGLKYDERSMVAWRKLTVWMLHHGPYKRKREELGVLAEVLGLEEKGRIWKG